MLVDVAGHGELEIFAITRYVPLSCLIRHFTHLFRTIPPRGAPGLLRYVSLVGVEPLLATTAVVQKICLLFGLIVLWLVVRLFFIVKEHQEASHGLAIDET